MNCESPRQMNSYDYDLFVIGAGSGGVRAARVAAGHGAKVAIAEESPDRRNLRHSRLHSEKTLCAGQPFS